MPKMASIMPAILTTVTGFPITNNEHRIMNTLLEALATANVNEVTIDMIVKAKIFCSQFNNPSVNNNAKI
jgi:hypothetical protein